MHAVLRSEDASETVSVSVSRDVRNRFFNFGSVSVLEKNSDSVWNEFGSVRVAKTRFG